MKHIIIFLVLFSSTAIAKEKPVKVIDNEIKYYVVCLDGYKWVTTFARGIATSEQMYEVSETGIVKTPLPVECKSK